MEPNHIIHLTSKQLARMLREARTAALDEAEVLVGQLAYNPATTVSDVLLAIWQLKQKGSE